MPYRISAKPIIPEYGHNIWMKTKRLVQRVLVKINIWSHKVPIWPFTPLLMRTRRYETGKIVVKRSPQDLLKAKLWPRRPRPWADPAPMLPPIPKTRAMPFLEEEEIFQITYENKVPEDWKRYMYLRGFDAGWITHRPYEMHNGLKILNKVEWEKHRSMWKSSIHKVNE